MVSYMKTYKYSRYNIIAHEDAQQVLLYNTFSLNWRYIRKMIFNAIKDKDNIAEDRLPEVLIKEGFFVESDTDEIQKLKDEISKYWADNAVMDLSIFTTLACNYRCVYCFEMDHLCNSEHMSMETADEIVKFIKRRYANTKFKYKLHIKWFGGEPLLNMPIIRHISKELKNSNIDFIARIYTNGRLLTKEIAQELKELGVTDNCVIPLDGLAQTYAKLKQCREEDFYTVIKNIQDCQDILKIRIQINTSDANKDEVGELYRQLREVYHIKCRIIYSNVLPMNANGEVTSENNVDYDDFSKIRDTATKYTKVKKASGCEAKNPNFYTIGTKGETYICEHMIGQEKYITGNIRDYDTGIDRTGTIWSFDKIIDDCSDCPILPLCLGNCTSRRYVDNIPCHKEAEIESVRVKIKKLSEQKASQK